MRGCTRNSPLEHVDLCKFSQNHELTGFFLEKVGPKSWNSILKARRNWKCCKQWPGSFTCTSKYPGVCHHQVAGSNILLIPSPFSPGKTPAPLLSGFKQNSGSICETGHPSSSINWKSTSTFPGERVTNFKWFGALGASEVRHVSGSDTSDHPTLLRDFTLKRYAVAIFSFEAMPCQISSRKSEDSFARLMSSTLISTEGTSCHRLKKSAVQYWSWHSKTGAWLGVFTHQWSSKPSVKRLMHRGASQTALPKVSHSQESSDLSPFSSTLGRILKV